MNNFKIINLIISLLKNKYKNFNLKNLNYNLKNLKYNQKIHL